MTLSPLAPLHLTPVHRHEPGHLLSTAPLDVGSVVVSRPDLSRVPVALSPRTRPARQSFGCAGRRRVRASRSFAVHGLVACPRVEDHSTTEGWPHADNLCPETDNANSG